jgi:hypothetical protein
MMNSKPSALTSLTVSRCGDAMAAAAAAAVAASAAAAVATAAAAAPAGERLSG